MKQNFIYYVFLILFFIVFSTKTIYASDLNDFNVKLEITSDSNDDLTAKLNSEGFKDSDQNLFQKIIVEYGKFIIGFFGVSVLTNVGILILLFIKLGAADNPMTRKKCTNGLMWSIISCTLLGGFLFIAIFFFTLWH